MPARRAGWRSLRYRVLEGVLGAILLAAGVPRAAGATEIAWVWLNSDAPGGGYAEAALLVESFVFTAEGFERQPRTRPLALPGGMRLTPVIHVEAGPASGTRFSGRQRAALRAAFERQLRYSTSGWVQLDFEAPARQRAAYVELVRELQAQLAGRVRLSATVLAAWCAQGDWLQTLAAHELVPMLYRLGPAAAVWQARWSRRDPTLAPRCLGEAVGYALREAPAAGLQLAVPRRYWFNARNWPRVLPR